MVKLKLSINRLISKKYKKKILLANPLVKELIKAAYTSGVQEGKSRVLYTKHKVSLPANYLDDLVGLW